jgi:hypothetical protein
MHINKSKRSAAAATAATLFTLATIAFVGVSARVIIYEGKQKQN